MANNTILNVGAGGDTIRDLDRAGVKTPVVALDLNPAGSETLMAGAMPVTGTFFQATQPVSIASAVPVTGTFWQATQPVSIAASVGVTQSGSWTVTVVDSVPLSTLAAQSGTWTVGVSGSVAVTGTFWQATQPVSGTVTAAQATAASLNATVIGTGTFAVQAAQSGTWNVGTVTTVTTVAAVTAITNALPAGTNTIGGVSLVPATSGGLSTSSLISAATTNATSVKGSAGQVFGYAIFNTTASAIFVKLYDKATAPTVGTDTPVRRLMVPANGGIERTLPNGLQFSSGIALAVTANAVDADATAVTSGAILLNIDYK